MWGASLGLSQSQEWGLEAVLSETNGIALWFLTLIRVSPWALPVRCSVCGRCVSLGSCSGPGRGLLSIHSMQVVGILSSKALCKIQVKWQYIKEDALVSAVSNMWYLQTINIFNGFNSYFWISLSPFTAFEDQTATLPGMVFCCPIDFLNLTKSLTELVTNSFVWTWKVKFMLTRFYLLSLPSVWISTVILKSKYD